MIGRETSDRHSDLGPSSKDWDPGSVGRDEDFTPDKDRWTLARKGDLGEGRPGEDVHASPEAEAGKAVVGGTGEDVQPGTAQEGKSWHSHRPDPDDKDDQLEAALQDTFPTSDPPSVTQPGVTGWDVGDDAAEKGGGRKS